MRIVNNRSLTSVSAFQTQILWRAEKFLRFTLHYIRQTKMLLTLKNEENGYVIAANELFVNGPNESWMLSF